MGQKIPSGHPKVYEFFSEGIDCLHAAASLVFGAIPPACMYSIAKCYNLP